MNEFESKEELFEKAPIPKALMTLAVPTIISQLIHLIYNIADTLYIGRTGNPYMIAGASLVFPLYILGVPICNLFGIGGGSQIARMMGRGDSSEAGSVSSYSFWMSVICSLVYSLAVFIFMDPILRFLGASEQTMLYSRQYALLVAVLGTLPATAGSVLAHLLRNTGYSKQASYGMSGGGILNIILDPLFMFVLFPKGMEVFAAALATLLSNIASLIYLAVVLIRLSDRTPLSLKPRKAFKINRIDRRQVYVVGIPSAILSGLYDVSTIVLNSRMSMHGDLQLAAVGIVMKIERLSNAFGMGLSQGMLPLVAYNFAAGNKERMKETIKTTRKIGVSIAATCTLMYFLLAKPLCSAFMNTTAGAEAAVATLSFSILFLRLRCLASPMQFMNFSSSYSLQGMGDGTGTLIHAVMRILVVYIPAMLILDSLFGQNGLVVALPVSELISAAVAWFLLRHRIKKSETAQA